MIITSAFSDVAGIPNGILATNPQLVNRLRLAAENLSAFEIAAHLGNAITSAADSRHARSYEEAYMLEASYETIADCEYYSELAAAWSIIAAEHHLTSLDALMPHDGSVH